MCRTAKRVRIVCAVVKNRMMTTKSNSMMAFTSVEDLTGTMEVIVFPKVLDGFRDALKENAVVVIDGRPVRCGRMKPPNCWPRVSSPLRPITPAAPNLSGPEGPAQVCREAGLYPADPPAAAGNMPRSSTCWNFLTVISR